VLLRVSVRVVVSPLGLVTFARTRPKAAEHYGTDG